MSDISDNTTGTWSETSGTSSWRVNILTGDDLRDDLRRAIQELAVFQTRCSEHPTDERGVCTHIDCWKTGKYDNM